MKKIIAYQICEKYNFNKLPEHIEEKYKFVKYWDFLVINNDGWTYFIYNYGTIVSWNNSIEKDNKLIEDLKEIEINSNTIIKEEYCFNYDEKFYIKSDVFYIPDNQDIKIAISYSISQSIKLDYFEDEIEKEIKKTKHIPYEIKNKWKTNLTWKEIAKIKWELFITKSLLNLHYDLLDEPEFFWDYPELLHYYEKSKDYLDINDRIEILNKKLSVIEELFEMLTDEINHKHEVFLEWIIIWLIVIEVFISIFHDILGWL